MIHSEYMTVISRTLLVFLSLLGMADAGYITYEEFSGVVPPCLPIAGFDCGAVLQSQWSHIGPIPLSLLGLGFYATVFVLASYSLVAKKPHRFVSPLLLFLGVSGFLFSVYLVYIQAFIIGAFCTYCMLSAFTSTAIFAVTTWNFFLSKKEV